MILSVNYRKWVYKETANTNFYADGYYSNYIIYSSIRPVKSAPVEYFNLFGGVDVHVKY
jgi:hypothetical protein